jgi:hypothetical protein
MHPTTLRLRLAAGIPNITSRTAALRELLLQAPAPVVARMLGYSTTRAEHLAAAAGSTWKTYAPGDHDAGRKTSTLPGLVTTVSYLPKGGHVSCPVTDSAITLRGYYP